MATDTSDNDARATDAKPPQGGVQSTLFHAKLSERFGSAYAELITYAARRRRALVVNAALLNALDTDQVTDHLAKLHEIAALPTVARTLLVATGVIRDRAQTDRLPARHIATMLDHLDADLGYTTDGPRPHDVVTIDTAIARLVHERERSPLGGDTVLHWSEDGRPLEPVHRVELDADGDGAVITLSPAADNDAAPGGAM